ncbi:PfkB family carbohydrate kinase [Kitasatospora sp. NPDC058162]|uniref:PfkB family carbohydrate kinase n=1 Tax=Kitasatospora sp. NPDC058162 TaxID=3346362 RepID=UPI0036DDDD0A
MTVIALDVGGTEIKGAVVAGDGTVLRVERRLTRADSGPGAVIDTVLDCATDLADLARRAGARAAAVSLGPGGLLLSSPEGDWRARPPQQVRGNPTGAGDSAVAALTAGLVAGTPWPERLAQAVALSVATVLAPLAGGFDPADHRRLLPEVTVRPVHPEAPPSSPQGEPCPS